MLNEELLLYTPLSSSIKEHEFGLPHRLDKHTSGLMILTKNNHSYNKFITAFNQRLIRKKYIAFYDINSFNPHLISNFQVLKCKHNKLNFVLKNQDCFCDIYNKEPIQISMLETKYKVKIDANGYPTSTILDIHPGYIDCYPITGYKHQLRVLLHSLNYPICGDPLYGKQKYQQMLLFSIGLSIPLNLIN